ncbi:MAG: ComEC/Rec2 family competence protein [Polyangiaceae bacterium]
MRGNSAAALVAVASSALLVHCRPTLPDVAPVPASVGSRPVAPDPVAPPGPRSPTPADVAARGGRVDVRFLDVGQGDATLVRTSDGHALLVDSGPPEAAAVVERAVHDVGDTLDALVLSHAHADHMGRVDALASRIRLGSLFEPGFAEKPTAVYGKVLRAAKERGIPVRSPRRGERFDLGAYVSFAVLGPSEPLLARTRSDVNANSIVLRMDHRAEGGDVRVLFEADAEAETEKRLLEAPDSLRADVLKVAHHGSKYASSRKMLGAVHPKFAVISCGLANDYGHPNGETLTRLHEANVTFFRTDLDGTIDLVSEGHGPVVTPSRPADPATHDAAGVRPSRHEE